MKPRKSAPHASAASASTSVVIPQTLMRMPAIIEEWMRPDGAQKKTKGRRPQPAGFAGEGRAR
ncbi:MAG: hypothetical protein MZV63_19510 [Marinilabiliales bacterium]|nr:hypothetical protein [Marinilabiliales bacterium]